MQVRWPRYRSASAHDRLAKHANEHRIPPKPVGFPPLVHSKRNRHRTLAVFVTVQTSERAERWLAQKPRYCSTVEIPRKLSASAGSLAFSMGKPRIHR